MGSAAEKPAHCGSPPRRSFLPGDAGRGLGKVQEDVPSTDLVPLASLEERPQEHPVSVHPGPTKVEHCGEWGDSVIRVRAKAPSSIVLEPVGDRILDHKPVGTSQSLADLFDRPPSAFIGSHTHVVHASSGALRISGEWYRPG